MANLCSILSIPHINQKICYAIPLRDRTKFCWVLWLNLNLTTLAENFSDVHTLLVNGKDDQLGLIFNNDRSSITFKVGNSKAKKSKITNDYPFHNIKRIKFMDHLAIRLFSSRFSHKWKHLATLGLKGDGFYQIGLSDIKKIATIFCGYDIPFVEIYCDFYFSMKSSMRFILNSCTHLTLSTRKDFCIASFAEVCPFLKFLELRSSGIGGVTLTVDEVHPILEVLILGPDVFMDVTAPDLVFDSLQTIKTHSQTAMNKDNFICAPNLKCLKLQPQSLNWAKLVIHMYPKITDLSVIVENLECLDQIAQNLMGLEMLEAVITSAAETNGLGKLEMLRISFPNQRTVNFSHLKLLFQNCRKLCNLSFSKLLLDEVETLVDIFTRDVDNICESITQRNQLRVTCENFLPHNSGNSTELIQKTQVDGLDSELVKQYVIKTTDTTTILMIFE